MRIIKYMEYNLFIDESGDHGLVNINESFPVFLLCGLLIESNNYKKIRGEVNELKTRFWEGKKVILHSRDIRKCEKEFVILFDEAKKKDFYDSLNSIFISNKYTLIASGINKTNYVLKHGRLGNDVYEIALSFIIEKTLQILKEWHDDQFELKIFIEKRGRKEDQQLSEHFQKIKHRGSALIEPLIFSKHIKNISFKFKKEDINGLQLADLAAYPIARYVIDTARANPAFEILKDKIYHKEGNLNGLIIYP